MPRQQDALQDKMVIPPPEALVAYVYDWTTPFTQALMQALAPFGGTAVDCQALLEIVANTSRHYHPSPGDQIDAVQMFIGLNPLPDNLISELRRYSSNAGLSKAPVRPNTRPLGRVTSQ